MDKKSIPFFYPFNSGVESSGKQKPHKLPEETTVVVAMSGGVDSSVVAALLKHLGYNVIGMTLQLYDNNGVASKSTKSCCGIKDIHDARDVAAKIGIPHYVVNKESVFKEFVMDRFADDYLSGITPVPCIRCNQTVKFTELLGMAKDVSADFMATGHYVNRLQVNGKAELHKALDPTKDQSYFLFATTQEQLEDIIFPLGNTNKAEVRKLAKYFGLSISDKKDSQDICFVPDGNYAEVVKKIRPSTIQSGDIIHVETGQKLGTHNGLINYTVGQRRGINVSHAKPLYVTKMNFETQTLYVGEEENLYTDEFEIEELNVLDDIIFDEKHINDDSVVMVCIRALKPLIPAHIVRTGNQTAKVKLLEKGRAITKGQACVAYVGSRVVGGGIIS